MPRLRCFYFLARPALHPSPHRRVFDGLDLRVIAAHLDASMFQDDADNVEISMSAALLFDSNLGVEWYGSVKKKPMIR